MLDAFLKTLHVMSVIVWIGGMVFAHFFLRPSLAVLEPPSRLALMAAVLGRFFRAVMVAAPLAWVSGLWMLDRAARAVAESGGVFLMPVYWSLMAALGTVMLGIFLVIRFGSYRALLQALNGGNESAAAAALGRVRQWVVVNLALGVLVLLVTLLRWP
jgi:uncharacterized membrane protein